MKNMIYTLSGYLVVWKLKIFILKIWALYKLIYTKSNAGIRINMRKHMQKWRLVYMEQNKINGNNNTEVKCCCCGGNVKKTERAEKDKKKLVNRLSRIEGQIRGIKKMIENDAYCNDVLIQSAAVGAAINAFNRELLSNHIHSCVVRDIREGKDEVVDELMVTLQKLIK